MAALANADKIHFPSEQKILEYLAMHPLTDDNNPSWYAEKRIAQAVAPMFANVTMHVDDLRPEVIRILQALNLGVPGLMLNIVTGIFVQALTDCGNGKTLKNLNLRNFMHCAS